MNRSRKTLPEFRLGKQYKQADYIREEFIMIRIFNLKRNNIKQKKIESNKTNKYLQVINKGREIEYTKH